MLEDGFHDVAPGKLAMVVTHLEMKEPQQRGATLANGLSFAELPRDIDVYRDLFRRIGQDWLWFGRLLLADTALQAIIEDPKVALFTLLKDDRPEAILELDFRVPGECELAYFGLTSALIGTGAGAFLMDRAVDTAFAADIQRLHVHTCTIDSQQALPFYLRSGFVAYRQQIEVSDDPRLTGLHPVDAAPHVPLLRDPQS